MGRGTGGGRAASNPPDYYRLLQVDPDAPQEVVVEAYWHLAGRLQSSRQAVPALREHLNALNEAYATLVNSERRKAYDATLPRVARLREERARAIQAAGCRRWPVPPRRRRRARFLDYYAILCVDPHAEPAIVELAYSVLRLLHADGQARGLKELAEAHAVLSDPALRAAYDASLPEVGCTPASPAKASRLSVAPESRTPEAFEAAASPRGPAPPRDNTGSSASVPAILAGAAGAAGSALGRGLAAAVRGTRRFVAWLWPIVRDRTRQFAAWAWPIVKAWSRRLAILSWRGARALARTSAHATRRAVAAGMTRYRERQSSVETLDDGTVRSRLARGPDVGRQSGLQGKSHLLAGPHPPAWLVVESGVQTGEVFELNEEPVVLGSDDGCSLRLAGDEGGVAGEHARIWRRQGHFVIRQLGGYPCISVGGRAVPWAVLEDSDLIEIGPHVLRFQLAGPNGQSWQPATGGANGQTEG